MKRVTLILLIMIAPLVGCATRGDPSRPNIVLILADDLGYGEVGAYGQLKIKTPTIDRLSSEGMRFTHFYSGSPVCAPSRCTLLTGLHTGHAYIRANYEMGGWGPDEPEGQLPLPDNTETIATILKDRGYATGAFGKWGLGGPDSSGHPNNQGFDHWYGYLCQRVAHNYYPTHLWRNGEKHILEGNTYFRAHQRLKDKPTDESEWDAFSTTHYAPDLMIDEALQFIRNHQDEPFFVYYATPVPHAAIQVPDDSLAPYLEEGWDEQPYLGNKGYLPHPAPRAGYAAMVSRMDRDIGSMTALLDELRLADNTIVIFTSDNGPTFNGGTDSTFFDSAAGMRGLKTTVYEGGIRVPFIVRWPRNVEPGTTSDHVGAFWDVLPTILEILGEEETPPTDGLSIVPVLTGANELQAEHEYLYWEYVGHQAIRSGKWKAVRPKNKPETVQLYNLKADPAETTDVSADHPDVTARMAEWFMTARTESEHFPLRK